MSPPELLELERARYAWECVRAVKNDRARKYPFDEYLGEVQRAPAMVLTCGLGQTLAFLYGKGSKNGRVERNSAEGQLYLHITGWLCRQSEPRGVYAESTAPAAGEGDDETGATLERIVWGGTVLYRRATREVLALLEWLKSFAEGQKKGMEARPQRAPQREETPDEEAPSP